MERLLRGMKHAWAVLFFAALVLQGFAARSQLYEKTIVHAGDSISKHYSYLFPFFQDATVKFRDGRSFVYKINFNTVLCDMQFINPKGDTLVITNAELIDSILVDSCSFIYDYQKGYFQILAVSDAAKLVVHRQSTFDPVQIGGMGEERSSGGVEMINSVSGRQGTFPLVLSQDIYVLKKTSYLVVYKNGEMENAGKAAFMKIYGGDKKSFDQFVKANKIDFNKQGDLEKLFHSCTQSKI
jgi:hypothetical protein